jgi:hypothetical protein
MHEPEDPPAGDELQWVSAALVVRLCERCPGDGLCGPAVGEVMTNAMISVASTPGTQPVPSRNVDASITSSADGPTARHVTSGTEPRRTHAGEDL